MLSIVIWSLHKVYIYQNSTLYTMTVTSRKANQFSTTGRFETLHTKAFFFSSSSKSTQHTLVLGLHSLLSYEHATW